MLIALKVIKTALVILPSNYYKYFKVQSFKAKLKNYRKRKMHNV